MQTLHYLDNTRTESFFSEARCFTVPDSRITFSDAFSGAHVFTCFQLPAADQMPASLR